MPGFVSDQGRFCNACLAGTQSNPDASFCRDCIYGQYSGDGVSCGDCQAGQEPQSVVAAPGCQNCSAGRFSTIGEFCRACDAGFEPNNAQVGCNPCLDGSHAADGMFCIACVPGNEPDGVAIDGCDNVWDVTTNTPGFCVDRIGSGDFSRRRDCHPAAPPSNFSRRFNTDGEGMSVK